MIRAAILTVSDRCAREQQEDRSTSVLAEILSGRGFEIAAQALVPDEQDVIARELVRLCGEGGCDIVFTAGGTGLGPRDVTPEATRSVCDRLVPGLGELMRAESLKKTRYAVLSRGTAGLRVPTGEVVAFPTNTSDALTSGGTYAIAGAIERMHRHLAERAGEMPLTLITGGAGWKMAPWVTVRHTLIDTLIFDGLLTLQSRRLAL